MHVHMVFLRIDNMIIKHNIVMEITNQCNMRCKHCYNSFDEKRELPIDVILNFIAKVHEHGETPSIILTGGETLLHTQIKELIKQIEGKNDIRINTNGILLHLFIPFLKTIKALRVQVSLDGYDEESYYFLRNSHCFNTVLKNIILAKEVGIDVVVRITLTKYTIKQYEKFIELLNGNNIPMIIRPMIYTGVAAQNDLLCSYDDIFAWIDDASNKGYTYCMTNKDVNSRHICSLYGENPYIGSLYIKNTGDVYPCQLLTNNAYKIGNIWKDAYENMANKFDEICYSYKRDVDCDECESCKNKYLIGNGTCLLACFLNNRVCGTKIKIGDL